MSNYFPESGMYNARLNYYNYYNYYNNNNNYYYGS